MAVLVPAFKPFPKIARLSRDVVITEKIDGTNGVIFIPDAVELTEGYPHILAGSRNRWLEPGKGDNFGFAAWVLLNAQWLIERLGPGTHHGEWHGHGIQRGYGLDHKRFSLFNPMWRSRFDQFGWYPELDVVPVLAEGPFSLAIVETALDDLALHGSAAAPGFMQPEGVVIFHTASRTLFKKTLLHDEKPKGSSE